MRRGTTPTIKLNVSGVDIETISDWYITVEQDAYQITKTNDDIEFFENGLLQIYLSQEETLNLHKGDVQVQIRAVTVDGARIASDIQECGVEEILYEGII